MKTIFSTDDSLTVRLWAKLFYKEATKTSLYSEILWNSLPLEYKLEYWYAKQKISNNVQGNG